MFGYSWCVTSVLGRQVFRQALMESFEAGDSCCDLVVENIAVRDR